ncbi:MAG: hypothetical protein Q4Q04_05710 [Methanocorpusculum sp.]|nr:hypothetical protein [Methanocorpusculum sp.]
MTQNKTRSLFAALVIAAFAITAGCITPAVPATPTDIPADMYHALNELTDDLSMLQTDVLASMTELADNLSTTAGAEEIRQQLLSYYVGHPCFTAVIFRDSLHGSYISVPVFLDIDLSAYSVNITEQDFRDAGGFIIRNNVFTNYHGYQNLYYEPVYAEDHVYHGYLVFVTDVYSLLYLHPDLIGKDRAYDDYICFIAGKDGSIVYSSIAEAVGEKISAKGYDDALVYVPAVENGDGACHYTSIGFYIYDTTNQTEKITAWHKLYSVHGTEYTLYLIKELNQPEMKTENVFLLTPLQALNDTRGAYVYASQYGKEKIIERVTSGYYQTPLYVMDMQGNVLAASNQKKIGRSYLSVRSLYGVSYVEAAILAAEQGSGYIYYLTPGERTVKPRAAQYTLGMVMPVDDYYIYAKTPGAEDMVISDETILPAITQVSHAIVKTTGESGLSYAEGVISSRGKEAGAVFLPGLKTDLADIAILDMEGNVYASVMYPELVGKSATFMTDVYGGSLTRRTDLLAKTGGGYLTQLTANPDNEGYVDLLVATVDPVNDEFYVYVSAHAGTFKDVLTPVMGSAGVTV